MNLALRVDEQLPAYSVMVETPDGTMWVTIIERDGNPVQVLISIGKAGSALMAWAFAMERMITRLLEHESIYTIIEEVSGITSEKLKVNRRGGVCRSGPEGIAQAFLDYRKEKFREHNPIKSDQRRLNDR